MVSDLPKHENAIQQNFKLHSKENLSGTVNNIRATVNCLVRDEVSLFIYATVPKWPPYIIKWKVFRNLISSKTPSFKRPILFSDECAEIHGNICNAPAKSLWVY